MPATIGVNSHLQRFFKILPVRPAAKVCKIITCHLTGRLARYFGLRQMLVVAFNLALHAKVGGQQWPGTMLWQSRHCGFPFYFQTTHRLVTTGSLRTRRSSNGSISSRAGKDCAARLPTASVSRMWTGMHRRGTTVCVFTANGLMCLTPPL